MKKEEWFFKSLLERHHGDVLPRCGLQAFRSVLVEKYEAFATESFVTDQPGGLLRPVFHAGG